MAISNRQRVNKALELLNGPLTSFVEQELRAEFGDGWAIKVNDPQQGLDNYQALQTIIKQWKDVFEKRFDYQLRNAVYAVRDARNGAAHDKSFTGDETSTALINIITLLDIISAPQSVIDEVDKLKEAHYRNQLKKEDAATGNVETGLAGLDQTTLRPWREVAVPHDDVRSGEYDQAEFAADLWQIHEGAGREEYLDPIAFYARTFLTSGLTEMLERAVKRLAGVGGDPVVELQVTFGGGKTHSMIALYHLCSGVPIADLPGMESFAKQAGIKDLSHVNRAVLVGTSMRPGQSQTKDDGTQIRTIWGEIAWQLAGREGYELVRSADETATAPGSALDDLFKLSGPSVILIDEWVAYARQLYNRDGHLLPAGDFDTQFTFAQALCEAARRASNVVVCISVPASVDANGQPLETDHVGGEAGRAATNKLKAAVGRQNLVWRPATTNESFEIVRRRLFEPIESQASLEARSHTVEKFRMHYLQHQDQVPENASKSDYKEDLLTSYPIHPEVFKVLFEHWGSLERFQRTRGVLKLMSQVIHELWASGDKSPMIMPCSIPVGTTRVEAALTNLLGDTWSAVVSKDVEGPTAIANKIDNANPHLGAISAARRAARAIFMDTAPMKDAAARGIDGKKLRLSCTIPGERLHLIDGALEKLKEQTQYLYHKDGRSWFDTQVNINVLANELADSLTKEHVRLSIIDELTGNVRLKKGGFPKVIVAADASDVPDETVLRLVILGPEYPHTRNTDNSPAMAEARHITERRGEANRLFKNTLLFCAPDGTQLARLEQLMRQYLAWKKIFDERQQRNLDPAHQSDSISRRNTTKAALDQLLAEVFSFMLVPTSSGDLTGFSIREVVVTGSGNSIAERAWHKASSDEICTSVLGWPIVRQKLNQIEGLKEQQVISVKDLLAYHGKYLYMTRVTEPSVVSKALSSGMVDAFGPGWASTYNPETDELEGVILNEAKSPFELEGGYYVVREKAEQYLTGPDSPAGQTESGAGPTSPAASPDVRTTPDVRTIRCIGQRELSLNEMASEVKSIRDNIVDHLNVAGATVKITLDIVVDAPDGIDDKAVRVVKENANSLGVKINFERG